MQPNNKPVIATVYIGWSGVFLSSLSVTTRQVWWTIYQFVHVEQLTGASIDEDKGAQEASPPQWPGKTRFFVKIEGPSDTHTLKISKITWNYLHFFLQN